jgi:hypothetical protein
MIARSNRMWIVLLLASLILSFGHANAQQETHMGPQPPQPETFRTTDGKAHPSAFEKA